MSAAREIAERMLAIAAGDAETDERWTGIATDLIEKHIASSLEPLRVENERLRKALRSIRDPYSYLMQFRDEDGKVDGECISTLSDDAGLLKTIAHEALMSSLTGQEKAAGEGGALREALAPFAHYADLIHPDTPDDCPVRVGPEYRYTEYMRVGDLRRARAALQEVPLGSKGEWSHEPPTEPGWWWYRSTFIMRSNPTRFDDDTPSEPKAAEYRLNEDGFICQVIDRHSGELGRPTNGNPYSQWFSIPILPPVEEEVKG